MSRPRKSGRKATGIQAKSGFLYIVTSKPVMVDGVKKYEKTWKSTGLADTPENLKKVIELREKMIVSANPLLISRNITLKEYIALFLEKKKREISDTTYSSYCYRADIVLSYFEATRVRDINELVVELFLDSLFEVRHMQQRTVKDIKSFLSYTMEQAIKDGIIANNPVKEVKINKKLADKYAKEKTPGDDFFSYEEAQLFLSKIKDEDLYILFYFTLFFGLRREEVLGLRWSCIDFKNKTMTINHTVTKGTAVNRLNATKTDSSARQYPLGDEQIALLVKLKEKEKQYRKLFKSCYFDSDYIFKQKDGSLHYPDYPTKQFKKIIKSNPDLPQGITFHGLRSSCVSILVHKGIDIKSIQKWVGHKDLDTTLKIYAKVKESSAKKEISAAMNSILSI